MLISSVCVVSEKLVTTNKTIWKFSNEHSWSPSAFWPWNGLHWSAQGAPRCPWTCAVFLNKWLGKDSVDVARLVSPIEGLRRDSNVEAAASEAVGTSAAYPWTDELLCTSIHDDMMKPSLKTRSEWINNRGKTKLNKFFFSFFTNQNRLKLRTCPMQKAYLFHSPHMK